MQILRKYLRICDSALSHKIFLLSACAALLFLTFGPLLLLGNIPINIRDGFESNWGTLFVLNDSHAWRYSAFEMVPGIAHGIQRLAYPSEFYQISFLHALFPPIWAFILNSLLVSLAALFSMFLLLKKLYQETPTSIKILVSVSFATIPFWSPAALTIAGMPFFLWGYYSIQNESPDRDRSYAHWIPCLILPFLSSLFLAYIFLFMFLGCGVLFSFLKDRSLAWRPILYLTVSCMLFVLIDYRLFDAFLFGSDTYQSNRIDRHQMHFGMDDVVNKFKTFIFYWNDEVEAPLYQTGIVYVIYLTAAILLLHRKISWPFISSIGLFLCMGFVLAIWRWDGLSHLKDITIMSIVNWSRFHWLAPVLLYSLMGLCAAIIWKYNVPGSRALFCIFMIVQSLTNLTYKPAGFLYKGGHPTFSEFYAEAQFGGILSDIKKDTNNPVLLHLGLPSTISMYHHLPVLDFYMTNYPLQYKRDFRHIIAGELEMSPKLQASYDGWGDRVYMMSHEAMMGGLYPFAPRTKAENFVLEKNAFDFDAARKMGATHLLSAFKINDNRVKFVGNYGNTSSYWHIYLYKL